MKSTSAIRRRTISAPGRFVSTSRVTNWMFSRNDGTACFRFGSHANERWERREERRRERIVQQEATRDERRFGASWCRSRCG